MGRFLRWRNCEACGGIVHYFNEVWDMSLDSAPDLCRKCYGERKDGVMEGFKLEV